MNRSAPDVTKTTSKSQDWMPVPTSDIPPDLTPGHSTALGFGSPPILARMECVAIRFGQSPKNGQGRVTRRSSSLPTSYAEG